MKTSVAIPTDNPARRSTWFTRLARRQIHELLSRFDRDALKLIYPDGSSRIFGPCREGHEAAEIHIHDETFFSAALLGGEIGFGESYTEGHWTSPDLPRVLSVMIRNLQAIPGFSGSRARLSGYNLLQVAYRFYHRRRRNTRENSRRNIAEHYDLSNDFYQLWLDETWTYSSAWFNRPDDGLPEAQTEKYDRLCRNLQISPGMKVLEIGCGWGGFALHCARNYGAHVTGITISKAQYDKARERVAAAGLENEVEIKLMDYRDLDGEFDAIVSIEMLEAVGHEFLPVYFEQCERLLNPTGRIGLQVIICPDSRYDAMRKSADWIKRHIFPGGQLPSIKAILDATSKRSDLYLHQLETFGQHYATTLKRWRESFNDRLQDVQQLGFDPHFIRKWDYYLAYCEAAFRTRNIDVTQCILTRANNEAFG